MAIFIVVVVVVVDHDDQVEHEDVQRSLAERCDCRRLQE